MYTKIKVCIIQSMYLKLSSLQIIAETCPLLETIDLTRIEGLRDPALKALGKFCPLLTYVNL